MAVLREHEYLLRNPKTGKTFLLYNPNNKKYYSFTLDYFMHNTYGNAFDLGYVKKDIINWKTLGAVNKTAEEFYDFGKV